MEDRELLEDAAKAAGIDLIGWREIAPHGQSFGAMLTKTGVAERTWWNPLTDDGDALRLAVKLNVLPWPEVCHSVTFAKDQDHYDATRRAIVRAAAEIGKAM